MIAEYVHMVFSVNFYDIAKSFAMQLANLGVDILQIWSEPGIFLRSAFSFLLY